MSRYRCAILDDYQNVALSAVARAIGTPRAAKCDLIASILNPNSRFFATLAQESEITGKFLLVFNKFTRTITINEAPCAM